MWRVVQRAGKALLLKGYSTYVLWNTELSWRRLVNSNSVDRYAGCCSWQIGQILQRSLMGKRMLWKVMVPSRLNELSSGIKLSLRLVQSLIFDLDKTFFKFLSYILSCLIECLYPSDHHFWCFWLNYAMYNQYFPNITTVLESVYIHLTIPHTFCPVSQSSTHFPACQ